MKILIVAAEAVPFAKVGGLADVAGSLPKALRRLGHDARVVMPLYQMIEDDARWDLRSVLSPFPVEMNPHWSKMAFYKETEVDGLPFGFVGTDDWFTRSQDSESLYQPGGDMHLFFSEAVLDIYQRLGWIPDVIHVNDWHTGFIPVLMREKYTSRWSETATVFTIHNFAYQGEFGPGVLNQLDLPPSLFRPEGVEAWGHVNFIKAGCVFADQVNTVSPTYAREICTPEFGCGLDGLMAHLTDQDRLTGILNGIDSDFFDPEKDPYLPVSFSADDPAPKEINKQQLLVELGLPEVEGAPLFGVVSRLSGQKGLDLLVAAAEALFELPIQLVVQGLGEPSLATALRNLEIQYPKHFRFVERFDPDLAQRIYGGCDAFLMPSAFEPCGLGQMIAMRYGTLPVVRATGGLADTVKEGFNGFTFSRKDPVALVAAVARAVNTYGDRPAWTKLRQNAMKGDYSWDRSAQEYVDLYRSAIKSKALVPARPHPRVH